MRRLEAGTPSLDRGTHSLRQGLLAAGFQRHHLRGEGRGERPQSLPEDLEGLQAREERGGEERGGEGRGGEGRGGEGRAGGSSHEVSKNGLKMEQLGLMSLATCLTRSFQGDRFRSLAKDNVFIGKEPRVSMTLPIF